MFKQSTIDILNGKKVTIVDEPEWQEILPEILQVIHQCDISVVAFYVNSLPDEFEKRKFIDACAHHALNPTLCLDFDNIIALMNAMKYENAVSEFMTRMKRYYEILFLQYSNAKE